MSLKPVLTAIFPGESHKDIACLLLMGSKHTTLYSHLKPFSERGTRLFKPQVGCHEQPTLSSTTRVRHSPLTLALLGHHYWRAEILKQKSVYIQMSRNHLKLGPVISNFLSNPHCRDTMINHRFCS